MTAPGPPRAIPAGGRDRPGARRGPDTISERPVMEAFPLDPEDQSLIEAARAAITARFDDPNTTVGAAVRCASGAVFVGVNLDSSGYGPCAEPIALGAAVTAGERDVRLVVAVAGPTGATLLSPCGNCRQLLLAYAPDARVVIPLDGRPAKVAVSDLLPAAYRGPASAPAPHRSGGGGDRS